MSHRENDPPLSAFPTTLLLRRAQVVCGTALTAVENVTNSAGVCVCVRNQPQNMEKPEREGENMKAIEEAFQEALRVPLESRMPSWKGHRKAARRARGTCVSCCSKSASAETTW